MNDQEEIQTISLADLTLVTGGDKTEDANRRKGLVQGVGCLRKLTRDGTPGTNSYQTYLDCQLKAHQF